MIEQYSRWVCVGTARRGMVIEITGPTLGDIAEEGVWWYRNLTARRRVYGRISEAQLMRNWERM